MITDDKMKAMLFDAFLTRDVQTITRCAYDICSFPIVIFDSHRNIIAQYPEHPIGNVFFDEVMSCKMISYAQYKEFIMNGYTEATYNTPRPIFLNWGIHKDSPHLFMKIYQDEFRAGGISMICPPDFVPTDLEKNLMITLSDMLQFVQISASFSPLYNHTGAFFNNLLNVHLHQRKNILKEMVHVLKIDQNLFSCVLHGIHLQGGRSVRKNLLVIGKYLEQFFSNILVLVSSTEPEISVLLFNLNMSGVENNHIASHPQITDILTYLNDYNCIVGISQPFKNLYHTKDYCTQAKTAVKIGRENDAGKTTFFFSDYILDYLHTAVCDFVDMSVFRHYSIELLRNYDQQHNTTLLPTLIEYIKNFKSITKTASTLHLHKNSLTYRLNKIQELCCLNLNDPNVCYQLLLSYLEMTKNKDSQLNIMSS